MAVTYSYGAAPTYVKIASRTLSATSATVTFSNLPQGYTDLMLVMNTGTGAYTDNYITFNGDTGSNYSYTRIVGSPSGATSTRASNQSNLYFASSDTTIVSGTTVHFMNYSNSSIYKTLLIRNGLYGSTTNIAQTFAGLWRSTVPINSFTLSLSSSTWSTGSTFTIYGIKAALTPKATGGDLIVNDGVYWYHAFRNSGVFFTNQAITADYLVIAGGGGGGNASSNGTDGAGGGGAGGLRSTVTATGGGGALGSALSLTSNTAYTVTIGAGGAGGTTDNRGSNGNNSIFSTITSTGGGGGGGIASGQQTGADGGSGGGASCFAVAGGSANPSGQGYAGGTGATNGPAGGGGAGAVGSNGVTQSANGGNGGAGVSIPLLANPTSTGVSGYYAGGGGGAADATTGTAGLGGSGGGGTGYTPTYVAANGVPNTGGGGGGGGAPDGFAVGGTGGSGLVIVRYAV